MELYLIRHPEPVDWHGQCYGRKDLAVTPESVAAAAASVRAEIPERVLAEAVIFTSPLRRCRLFADVLAAPREPAVAEELIEIDLGAWEGRSWDEVPRAEVGAWALDLWGYRPGGGESGAMVAERWRRWTARVRAEHAGDGAPPIVAVTHGGLIRVALACAGKGSAEELALGNVPFGSVHRIDIDAHPPGHGLDESRPGRDVDERLLGADLGERRKPSSLA
jgi:alpha-ribazole phosphatase